MLAGATLLGVVAAGVAYFDLTPDERAALWHQVGRVIVWIGVMLVLPWATYFLTTAVVRRESNAAGAGLVTGYTALDVGLLLLLVGSPAATFGVVTFILGGLVALTYNLLTCDWIAERV